MHRSHFQDVMMVKNLLRLVNQSQENFFRLAENEFSISAKRFGGLRCIFFSWHSY